MDQPYNENLRKQRQEAKNSLKMEWKSLGGTKRLGKKQVILLVKFTMMNTGSFRTMKIKFIVTHEMIKSAESNLQVSEKNFIT